MGIRTFTILGLLPFILGITSLKTLAQIGDRSNARGMGMSNASMVTSFGIDAAGLNPANFDHHLRLTANKQSTNQKYKITEKPYFEISILSIGGAYGSDESIDFYNKYLSKLSINRETFTNLFTDLASVLDFRQNYLPAEQTNVNFDFELKWFSVNYSNPTAGAVNISISDLVGLNTNVLSRDEYLPLTFLYQIVGNKYNLLNVQLHQSEATAWWLRKYSIGYAKEFEFNKGKSSFSVGFATGLVNGFGNVLTYNSSLYTDTYGVSTNSSGQTHIDSIKGKQDFYTKAALTDFFEDYGDGSRSHYTFFPKPAGTGYSFDIGVNMKINNVFRIAVSVTDVGKITWDYNTKINYDTNHFLYKNFVLDKSDPTYNRFVNDLEGLDSRDTVSLFTTNLPTKYRAGFSFIPSDRFMAEIDWLKGDNNLPGNTTQNIIAAGTEFYPVVFLPIRAGVSIGGPETFAISLGTGLRFRKVTLDLAAYGINNMVTNKRLTFAFSSKLIL